MIIARRPTASTIDAVTRLDDVGGSARDGVGNVGMPIAGVMVVVTTAHASGGGSEQVTGCTGVAFGIAITTERSVTPRKTTGARLKIASG